MDQIRNQLGRISELSDDELTQLTDDIVAEFESADAQDLSPQVVDSMTELASALDAVREEKSRREEEAAELSRRRDEAAAKVKGAPEAEESEEDTVAEDVEPETDPATEAATSTPAETESDATTELATATAEPEAEAPAEVAEEPEATTTDEPADEQVEEEAEAASDEVADDAGAEDSASDDEDDAETTGKDSEAPVTAAADNQGPDVQAPASHRPKTTARASVAITAGADIPGVTAGTNLPNMRAIADAMAKRMHGMKRVTGGDGEQYTVASLISEYPEERVLRAGEPEANQLKIDKVASPAAITAAGGYCAPLETDYDIVTFGTTDRPVRDSLATFNADRGGIRWMRTPVLAGSVPDAYLNAGGGNSSDSGETFSLGDGYDPDLHSGGDWNQTQADGNAMSVWNEATDIRALTEDVEKPCMRIECLGEDEAWLHAVPLCFTVGNLLARTFPELIEATNNLALVAHSRFAEKRLLHSIGSMSTQVTAARELGAARDFLNQVDKAAVAYRHRHRLNDNEPMRVIAPNWMKNLIRADLVMEMPSNNKDDNFNLTEARITAWFRARNINVTWHKDGEGDVVTGAGVDTEYGTADDTVVSAGQYFDVQADGALVDYPANVVWYIFAEGTFLFLDGGTLDLGLVRDSTLNAKNDYKMFVETFEGVAKKGVESLRVVSSIEANGAAAALVDTFA